MCSQLRNNRGTQPSQPRRNNGGTELFHQLGELLLHQSDAHDFVEQNNKFHVTRFRNRRVEEFTEEPQQPFATSTN